MNSAYDYPSFKKIEIDDKDLFDKMLAGFPSYSDFNLLSLLSWDIGEVSSFSILNNDLVIRIKEYLGNGFNYSVLGKNDIDNSISTLLQDHQSLMFVPETVIELLESKDKYSISPDRDNFDYMVSTEKLAKLEGGEFKPLRRYVRNFEQIHPKYEVGIINLNEPSQKDEVVELTKRWVEVKGFDKQKSDEETIIMNQFLNYSKYFNCVSYGLQVSDKLIAFTLNEITHDKVVMGHFGKADNSFEHCSYFLEHKTAEILYNMGLPLLNHEQDTGIEGLRTTKITYRPISFLKKYKITLK